MQKAVNPAAKFFLRAAYVAKYVPRTFANKLLREVSMHEELVGDTVRLNMRIAALYKLRAIVLREKGIASNGRFFNPERLERKARLTVAITDEYEIYAKRDEAIARSLPNGHPKKIMRLGEAARSRVRQAELFMALKMYGVADYKLRRAIGLYSQCLAVAGQHSNLEIHGEIGRLGMLRVGIAKEQASHGYKMGDAENAIISSLEQGD